MILSLILIFSFLNSPAQAQTLEIIKSQSIKTTERFNGHRYGGISGLSYSDGFLWGISDDRGQFGTPRIYKHSIKNNEVKIEEEILVNEPKDYSVVDFEALFRFKDGSFLISSEGDLNKKPRVFPFVKFWSPTNKWGDEISLPEDFFPEKIGMQTKGLQNNSAFEAMTVTPDEKTLYMMSEVPLYQSQNSEIEFLEYEKKSGEVATEEDAKEVLTKVKSSKKQKGHDKSVAKEDESKEMKVIGISSKERSAKSYSKVKDTSDSIAGKTGWVLKNRRTYFRDLAPEGVFEVMRGVSELLYWNADHLLVLERSVRLNKSKAIVIGAELFSVNLKDLKKKKLFTFDGDLAANWEGMSWGPDLSDGRKLLILVSDNNFER